MFNSEQLKMFNSEQLKNFIDTKLNELASEFHLEDKLVFDGGVGFYNYDWVKEKFDKRITPYIITPIGVDFSNDKLKIKTSRYVILFLGFSNLRNEMNVLIDSFENFLSTPDNHIFEEYSLNFTFINRESGEDFSEGSGLGFMRFETAVEFEVSSSVDLFNSNDLVLTLNGNEVPVKSWRFERGLVSTLNEQWSAEGYGGAWALGYNSNNLVIETYITRSLNWAFTQSVNREVEIDLRFVRDNKMITIAIGKYSYDGFQVATEGIEFPTVFLYFSYLRKYELIRIRHIETETYQQVNILDYKIAYKTITTPFSNFGSGLVKEKYVGRALTYTFVLASTNVELFQFLNLNVFNAGETLINPYFMVDFRGTEMLMILLSYEIDAKSDAIIISFGVGDEVG